MDLVNGWLPPSRENWEIIVRAWTFFPMITAVQWLTDFWPQGKTSINSRFNLPGRWAWTIMECPGFLTVLYLMFTLPARLGIERLPVGNWTMAGAYTFHYLYRAIISPLFLNPSMSPIHPIVFISASAWQIMNGLSLGGWLAGYGPTTVNDWAGRLYYVEVGLVVWAWGLLGNMYHDDELREIRRQVMRQRREEAEQDKANGKKEAANPGEESVQKVYKIPKNGLFRFILYPHYLCEWIEWAGFWMIGGLACVPARTFLANEIATMLPRALAGRRWYIEKFGKEKIGEKKAVIPGLI